MRIYRRKEFGSISFNVEITVGEKIIRQQVFWEGVYDVRPSTNWDLDQILSQQVHDRQQGELRFFWSNGSVLFCNGLRIS